MKPVSSRRSYNERYGDLAGLAASPGFSQKDVNRQFTKMSWEIRNPAAIPLAVRRAFKVASTATTGPTYTAFADYALETHGVEGIIYPRDQFSIETNAHPDPQAIEELAGMLMTCKQPVLFVVPWQRPVRHDQRFSTSGC